MVAYLCRCSLYRATLSACAAVSLILSIQPNTSGYEEFSDEEITFGDDDFDPQEVCGQNVSTSIICVMRVVHTGLHTAHASCALSILSHCDCAG